MDEPAEYNSLQMALMKDSICLKTGGYAQTSVPVSLISVSMQNLRKLKDCSTIGYLI